MGSRQRLRHGVRVVLLTVLVLSLPAAGRAVDLEAKCRAEQVRDIGDYGRCRLETARAAQQAGRAPDYTQCEAIFAGSWSAKLPEGGCEQYAAERSGAAAPIRPANTNR